MTGERLAGLGLAVLLGLLIPGAVAAQQPLRVSATLSPTSIALGETAVLQITAETDGNAPEIILPVLPQGLEVIGDRTQTQMQFSIPGGRTRIERRELVLYASSPGTYAIPAVTVRADGTVRETPRLALEVTAAAPRAPSSSAESADAEVVLNAYVSADTVYVGEQIKVTTEAMLSDRARSRLRRAPEFIPPSPTGFWTHDFPRSSGQVRVIDGRIYEVQAFVRAYFPISAGRAVIPPARLNYEMSGGFLAPVERRELQSDSLHVIVLPVPERGRPASFTGAVGEYDVRASISPSEVAVGEPATLTVEVRGFGNVKMLPPPGLPDIPGAQVYPPSEEAVTEISGDRVGGLKRFTWIVIPEQPGRLEIPPIEYGHFDPSTRSFATPRTTPFVVSVQGAPVTASSLADRGIRRARGLPSPLAGLGWVRSPAFVALQALPLLALILGLWRRGRRDRPRAISRRLLRGSRRALISRLEALAADRPSSFLAAALDGTRAWLAERLGDETLAVAPPAVIAEACVRAGVDGETADGLARLLTRVLEARYEPAAPGVEARAGMVRQLDELLDAVDRGARVARAATAAGPVTASVLPAFLAILLGAAVGDGGWLRAASAGMAQVAAESEFESGEEMPVRAVFVEALAALDGGEIGAAVQGFREVTERDPRNATAWYDLGVACHEAGDRGCAVHAWLVALRLQPRDDDVRHNLTVAGPPAGVADRLVPPVPLSAEESILLGALAWFVTVSLAALRAARGHPHPLRPAALGLSFAALLLANWSVPSLRRPTVVAVDRAARLHVAPSVRADAIRELEPGEALRVVELRSGDWARVQSTTGEEGWVEATRVRGVEPGRGTLAAPRERSPAPVS